MTDTLSTKLPLVGYYRHTTPELPPLRAQLYEYLFAKNGVFIRAERPELLACIPLPTHAVRPQIALPLGDYDLHSHVVWRLPPVNVEIMTALLHMAWVNRDPQGRFREILFGLLPMGADWMLAVPDQTQGATFVHPRDPYDPAITRAPLEIHSHHHLPARFSRTDDQEETGFKLYGVLGDFDSQPALRLRVGVYGVHYDISTNGIVTLPPHLRDAVADEQGEQRCSDERLS